MQASSIATVESLESRALRAAVYPTAAEQYAVELINRARANPTAEAARYGIALNEGVPAGETISTAAKQPLAINPSLTDVARSHSAWEVASSTFSHTGAGGSTFSERDSTAGYSGLTTGGENIALNVSSSSLDATATVQTQQSNLFVDSTEAERGHRTNMLNGAFSEIGVGIATGPYNYPGYGTLQSFVSTHDEASNGTHFLTGVAYADTVSDDNFYTPGEGLGGVRVLATRVGDGREFSTTTWSSGGYSLPLENGTYDVVGYGGGVDTIRYGRVTIDNANVKVDFVAGTGTRGGSGGGATGGGTTVVTDHFAQLKGRLLVVNGTSAADRIGLTISDDKTQYVVAVNGNSADFAVASVDQVNVFAGEGNDRVVINAAYVPTYVEGNGGKDTLIGGAGPDTLYGNGGIDRIFGNAGNDVLVGENANDYVNGGYGNDRIYGGVGNDTLLGGLGNDRIFGGAGNDDISGGPGRDILHGESGADSLNGGGGGDYGDDDPLDTRMLVEVLD